MKEEPLMKLLGVQPEDQGRNKHFILYIFKSLTAGVVYFKVPKDYRVPVSIPFLRACKISQIILKCVTSYF